MSDINNNNLQFWRLQTFNDKLNATIAFIKLYSKPLFRALLYISGPFFFLGIGFLLYNANFLIHYIMYYSSSIDTNYKTIIFSVLKILLGGLFFGLSTLSMVLVCYEFIKTQMTRPDKIGDLSYLYVGLKKRVKKMVAFLFISVITLTLVTSVLNSITSLLFQIPILGAIIGMPIFFFNYVLVFSYLFVIIPTAYFEPLRTSDTISKGINLIKGHFWQTAGLFAGTRILQYVLLSGVVVPILVSVILLIIRSEYIAEGMMFNSKEGQDMLTYIFLFFMFIYMTVFMFSNLFYIIASAIHYFGLKEDYDNDHLYLGIENFDQLGK